MIGRWVRFLAGVLAISMLLVGCAGSKAPAPSQPGASGGGGTPDSPPAAKITTVRVGATSKVLDLLPEFIADRQGFFAKEGIKMEFITMGSSTDVLTALVGGSLEFFVTSPPVLLTAMGKGEKLKIVSGASHNGLLSLVAKPKYGSIKDLAGGAQIGSTGPGTGLYDMFALALKQQTIPDDIKKYAVLKTGGSPAIYQATVNGAVDAGLMLAPYNYMAVDKTGWKELLYFPDQLKAYQLFVRAIRDDWGQKNKSVVIGYLRAIKQATEYIYNDANRDKILQIIKTDFKIEDPYAVKTFDQYKKDVYDRDLNIAESAMEPVISPLIASKALTSPKMSDYTDLSYLKEAVK